MLETLPPSQIAPTQGIQTNSFMGLDAVSSIQILLVQDYDNQLQSLGNQIKGTTAVKKAYRDDIEALQNLNLKPTKGKGDNITIDLTEDEYNNILNGNYLHTADPKTGKLIVDATQSPAKDSSLDITSGQRIDDRDSKGRITKTTYRVKKDLINTKIEQYKSKLDSLNEQSELMSLSLQSLTNQRKIAFETISNLVNKQQETLSTIVRNVKS
jgi:hypothetical protein